MGGRALLGMMKGGKVDVGLGSRAQESCLELC